MSTAEHNQVVGEHHITPATPPMYPHEKGSPELSVNDKKDASSSERDLGLENTNSAVESEPQEEVSTLRRLYNKYSIFVHLFIWLVFTGYVLLSPSPNSAFQKEQFRQGVTFHWQWRMIHCIP